MSLVKVNWEAWKTAKQTPPPVLSKAVRQTPRNHSPVNVVNLSTTSTPASPSNNGAESPKNVECGRCGRRYKLKSSLRNHQKWECGKEPRFQCPYCVYRAKQKMHVERHIERMHKDQLRAFYDNNESLVENFGKEDVNLLFSLPEKGKDIVEKIMPEPLQQA
ncbi:UNVERIFIED_CONTAM: hypothetical protein PYX00_008100 [Menopon gallinae]|uniref:C2H2-type domain-containing protein n=1 Tax=Menopon gallinae TaxID=328185 RepID=A0AAW2HLK9_9NEOP